MEGEKSQPRPPLHLQWDFTLLQASATAGVDSHGPSLLGGASPHQLEISLIDQWTLGCYNCVKLQT